MDFYYHDLSPPCRNVMLTFGALGLSPKMIELDLFKEEHKTPEFLALNPLALIPTLKDGDFVIWESRAICTYLVNKYAKDDTLYPKDPEKRAMVDKMLYFDIGSLYQTFGDYAFAVAFEGATELNPANLVKLQNNLKFLDNCLQGKKYACGDDITLADNCLVASVSSMHESGIDISSYSNITSWMARCRDNMPQYQKMNDVGAKIVGKMIKEKLFP